MTVHTPLLKDVPVGKGRYSYQTHASLVGMVYRGALNLFRLRCGTVVGLNPQIHTDKHTGTRMSRHTDPSSLDRTHAVRLVRV